MSTCRIVRGPLATDSIHGNGDLLRVDRRIERQMLIVCLQQLKRVLARRQRQRGFRLALAEMKYFVRDGQRRVELYLAQVGIHQQMVMARIVEFDSGRGDPHSLEAEAYGDRAVDLCAIAWRNEINLGSGG